MEIDVVPGKSLGGFQLGMPIAQSIAFIQKHHKDIPHAELKYCEEDLLGTFIIIKLIEEGILLRFEPRTQRLHQIEVYDFSKVRLKYCNMTFSGPEIRPSFNLIYTQFGPSFPGSYDAEKRVYHLHYPGISFSFSVPTQCEQEFLNEAELPFEFDKEDKSTALRLCIYHGEHSQPTLPELPEADYFEEIKVYVSKGLYFANKRCILDFQSTSQDVISELGWPDKIFYKNEDKMRIHRSETSSGTGCADYFYNYFSLGLDILFDMQNHVVKKFILHTNFPCHGDFNVYQKCNFQLFFDDPQSHIEELFMNKEQPGNKKQVKAIRSSDEDKMKDKQIEEEEEKKVKEEEEKRKLVEEEIFGDLDITDDDQDLEEEESAKGKSPVMDEPDDTEDQPDFGVDDPEIEGDLEIQENGHHKVDKGKEKMVETVNEAPERVLVPVTPDMKWEEIRELLPENSLPSKPVVHSSGSNASPFGSTLFYGSKDVIFEVMRNQHIASVCLFI